MSKRRSTPSTSGRSSTKGPSERPPNGPSTPSRGRSNRLDAGSLLAVVKDATANGGVMTWAALRDEFKDLKRLRNVVRGLVRTGELEQDRAGNYYLPGAVGSGELRRGRVVAAPSDLFGRLAIHPLDELGSEALLPLPPPDRDKRPSVWLREGDTVHFLEIAESAQVIEVIEHAAAPLIGVLQLGKFGPFVDSLSPGFRGRVALDGLPHGMSEGDTVTVRVVGQDRFGLRGDVTGVVSRGDVADAAAVTLIASHGVPETFADEALAQADKLPAVIQPGRYKQRKSLVDTPLVTIDGADARDFDDAVYAEARRGGGWRLVVAIADVAHYVKSSSPLDQDAFERGNSVYLPDRVIPMLPESLSNGLCSLRPNEPRLSVVCDMRISKSGRITGYEFYDAIICSWARLTYSQVHEYFTAQTPLPIDEAGNSTRSPAATREGVQTNCDELRRLFGALLRSRAQRGALEFETKTGALRLQEGRVAEIVEVTRNDAHRLIEEAMIAANVCAARFIGGQDAKALYRVHEPPQADKADVLRDALAYAGIRVRDVPSDPKALALLLEGLSGRDDAWLLYSLILRAMSQARYQPENKGHFGLALTDYMHFTSPIRRYPDLIVHRVIKALVNGKRPPLQAFDRLLQAGEHLSSTERRAEEVERGVSNWLKCDFVASRIGETFAGTVVGVQEFGLFVELDGFFVQGLVHISNLGDDFFTLQAASQSLVGDRSGRRFQLGDALEVVLLDVQPAQGKLDLVPAAHHKAYKRSQGRQSGRGRGRGGKRR